MFWYNSIQFLFQIKHLGEDKKIFFAPLLALVDTSFQSERLSHEKGDTDEGKKCNSNKTEKAFSLKGCAMTTYSRVHKSSDSFFSKILEKPSIVQKKMIPHIKGLDFSQR